MRVFRLLMLIVALSAGFVACDKDDDDSVVKDYVGTWVAVSDESGYNEKEQMILNENTIQVLYQVETTTGAFVDFMAFKGDLKVSGKSMTVTLTSIAMAEIDFTAGTIGALVWYNKGTDEFDELIGQFGSETLEAEYSVSGSELTLITEGDETVYTKQ